MTVSLPGSATWRATEKAYKEGRVVPMNAAAREAMNRTPEEVEAHDKMMEDSMPADVLAALRKLFG